MSKFEFILAMLQNGGFAKLSLLSSTQLYEDKFSR